MLELTVVELDVLRKSYDSIQKDLEKIVSEFDFTQNQISKNFFLLKESITSQNEIIQENKKAISSIEEGMNKQHQQILEDIKPYIQEQTEKTTESLKNSFSENLKRFQEFKENQIKHNEAFNSEILNLSENILPNIIANLGDLGNVIVEIRRSVLGIDSKLVSPSGMVAEINVEG